MGLSKEIFRPKEAGVPFSNANFRSSEIKVSKLPTVAVGVGTRITELSQMLFAESKKGEETGDQPQEDVSKKDGFEPFVDPEPTDNPLFVNSYKGNFDKQMELNRRGIERVLKIAHLEGQITLTSLNSLRQRSVEANPDGSITGKRSLFWGEKIEDDKQNPFRRVVPVPEGWRIEINDGKIVKDLNEKKLTGEKLQKTFIKKFNKLLNQSLLECIRKEKMTDIKDKSFRRKVLLSVLNPVIGLSFWAPTLAPLDLFDITFYISGFLTVNALLNFTSRSRRKPDSAWEYFMPQVEIDKVARAWTFLYLKGRTLVKEAKQPENK